MTDIKYWLWLTLKQGISGVKITALLERFSTPQNVYLADKASLAETVGLKEQDVLELTDKSMESVRAVITVCRHRNIKILTYDNPMYPQLLQNIYDPPYVLYVRCRERLDLNDYLTVAVLGTRRASRYGIETAERFSYVLAREGALIVTGMARGIDGAANSGALRAGAKTVAVLGSGVDICYPKEHKQLMQAIIDNGMVISEYPPGMPPLAQNFPVRNRIITGLSYGTLVIEAPQSSGALISADRALEQNREVFAVPADVTRKSAEGSNGLLSEGVKPVFNAEDVLCEFREMFGDLLERHVPQPREGAEVPPYAASAVTEEATQPLSKEQTAARPQRKKEKVKKTAEPPAQTVKKSVRVPLSERERAVMALLREEPQPIDDLLHEGLSMQELLAALTMLEMKGLVKALPGRQYSLA